MPKGSKPLPSLDDRFSFAEAAISVGDRQALRSTIFEVEERETGVERNLKLWRKIGGDADTDLRELWRHEMRQVTRVMAYSGARDVIVEVLEIVEDDENFGVLLDRIGQPLFEKRRRVGRDHWLRTLAAPRSRALFWENIRRIASALGIVHAQGLVHGAVDEHAVMTEGSGQPDFQLGGFEWCISIGSGHPEGVDIPEVSAAGAKRRPAYYAFAEDWRCLGLLIATCLGVPVNKDDLSISIGGDAASLLSVGEERLLKRLLSPSRRDLLDAESTLQAVDEIVVQLGKTGITRSGSLILSFDSRANLQQVVYDATNGAVAVDEYARQREWVLADLQSGATVLASREFDPEQHTLRVATENAVYELRPSRPQGAAAWDHAICFKMAPRGPTLPIGNDDQHEIVQPILLARGERDAAQLRAQLGPDALDWRNFAAAPPAPLVQDETGRVRNALLIIQVLEAVVKALDAFPVQVLEHAREDGRPTLTLRALPGNERDKLAKKMGIATTADTLDRLFAQGSADDEVKWRLSTAASLGASRLSDVPVAFIDVADYNGGPAYRFEADEDLVEHGPWFLRGQKDVGSEQVIARRLRILKALDTRVDLAQMLLDPWRVRRSSRETLSKEDRADNAFTDLDKPKQEALVAIWETVPSFFVVGPPGVGKTRLATEVVTRRFKAERATRMLVTAQGHDALDHLKSKIQEALAKARIDGLMVVRSTTPERRKSTPDETSPIAVDLLKRLSNSKAMGILPPAFSERVRTLTKEIQAHAAAGTPPLAEPRSAFGAMMRLILDAADVVVSTVNSSDIERMVEGRDQFDWVIVEEAARATGPELVGALMLSARRLLIGDHRQLPAFDADRMVKVLNDHSLVEETLRQASRLLAPLLRDGELDEVEAMLKADAETLSSMRRDARSLLDPFREIVEQDERLRKAKAGHRAVSATLTEQRRMDPAIARIVSGAFYAGELTTSKKRADDALTEESPILHRRPMPSSPVVVVDFDHVSNPVRGTVPALEHGHPPWHNPSETDAVLDVLRHIHARPGAAPTLAILTPYRAQADKIRTRMLSERNTTLAHLSAFNSVRPDGQFVGTVDSFQGNEADLVILSLVRNNGRSGRGALGFLQDPRRMNVALSRAKSQLIIVGSLEFLKETVRGVNPERKDHDLDFLTKMTVIIEDLAGETRDDLRSAAIVKPAALRGLP